MGDEIKIDIALRYKGANGAHLEKSVTFKDDIEGENYFGGITEVTVNGVELVTGNPADIDGVYGWVFAKSLSTTQHYIDLTKTDQTDPIARLYGGESCIFKTPGLSELWADSSSGTQRLEWYVLEI